VKFNPASGLRYVIELVEARCSKSRDTKVEFSTI
jgi:hypothetical protein